MSSVNIAKNMKEIHPDWIWLFKQGAFFHVYEKDAIIILYFFSYQIKTLDDNMQNCGFPKKSINKVIARLEREKVNYIVLDVKNENDVQEKITMEI
ncbi:MAG: hypothetical protein IKF17_00320 [Clostridia bacterium]|nr:hypothetical protein [Clostridia bacterium]